MVKFGSTIPYAEPAWYDDRVPTPYFGEHQLKTRDVVRHFTDEEIIPYVDEWQDCRELPRELFIKASKACLLQGVVNWPQAIAHEKPAGFNEFDIVVIFDELCRCCHGGIVWGLVGATGIGLPLVDHFGGGLPEGLQESVVRQVCSGEVNIALAVTEPLAGSDVASLRTTAHRRGDHFVVNGTKKFITMGTVAKYFTTAVRTFDEDGEETGITLLLVERSAGVTTTPIKCMGVEASGTALVELDEVKVPVDNVLGGEGAGFMCMVANFSNERCGMAAQAIRFARECVRCSIEYAARRNAFGKKLIKNPVVINKVAEMARRVEAVQEFLYSLVFRVTKSIEAHNGDFMTTLQLMGGDASLLKVQATSTYDYCADQASKLCGGQSYVRNGAGPGGDVERLFRHTISLAVPGGSSDVMLDIGMRIALRNAKL